MSEDLVNEISAINSIYGENTLRVAGDTAAGRPTDCVLSIPNRGISLSIRFPSEYPDEHDPPVILGVTRVGEHARKGYGQHVWRMTEAVLQETYTPGSVCLFNVLDTLDARVDEGEEQGSAGEEQEQAREGDEERHKHITPEYQDSVHDHPPSERFATTKEPAISSDFRQSPLPTPEVIWAQSTAITVKKSVLLARATSVSSPVQAQACLAALVQTDRHAAKATHNISAYRIPRLSPSASFHRAHVPLPSPTATRRQHGRSKLEEPPDESDANTRIGRGTQQRFDEDFDDDGESAAGARLLKQLQLMDAQGVLVVVSRWYGGVKLGPARFGIICGAGKEAVVRLIEGQSPGKGEDQAGGGR